MQYACSARSGCTDCFAKYLSTPEVNEYLGLTQAKGHSGQSAFGRGGDAWGPLAHHVIGAHSRNGRNETHSTAVRTTKLINN